MNVADQQLPFNKERQDALLGHLLVDQRFFKQCVDRIKPEWFLDGLNSKVWAAKVQFWVEFKRIPTKEELLASEPFRLASMGERSKMNTKVGAAQNLTNIYGLDTLLPELTTWLHTRYFHEGISQSTAAFNNGKLPEAFNILNGTVDSIKTTTFERSIASDFSNYMQFFEEGKLELQNALGFGIEQFDKILLPDAEGKGSLLPGDTTILLAPTNVGKTSTMITVAAHNVWRCKPTLMLAHEGTERDIMEKMWCSMLNVNKAQLRDMAKDPSGEGQRIMNHALAFLQRFFKFIHMPQAGLTVEQVASVIRREQENRISQFGTGYALLVDDYPAKLTSENMKYGQFQKRNLDEYVYNYFVQLALEYKFHSLLAIQSNRTGSKINRGQKGFEERLLTPEDANESYGPCQIATNVVTINRGPLEEALGYVIYYICKSRSSDKGWAICCRTNFKNAITHSDSLGCTVYRGDVPLGDQMESLFVAHRGREIPRETLFSSATNIAPTATA
jgi:replicative DNA helicase